MKRTATLIAAATLMLATTGLAQAGTLTLKFDTGTNTGNLRAAVFENQTAFDAGNSVTGVQGAASGGSVSLALEDLKPGTYGIAVYLDENGDNELDRNLFGAPTEPFGFSMNPVMGFSAPKFETFSFEFDGSDTALDIKQNGV